jgi:hypothetical protein
MRSGGIAVGVGAITLCGALLTHACNRDCGNIGYGMQPNRVVTATIVRLHDAPDGGSAGAYSALPPCTGLDDLEPGTQLTWTATFQPFGEGCDCADTLGTIQLGSRDGQPVATQTGRHNQQFGAQLELDDGCSGWMGLEIDAPDLETSIFGPVPDAGAPAWLLVRTFSPDTVEVEGGTCPVTVAECADSFVAECTQ